jgi:CelD/BcsL family acetyltransferase involved in cellulose biosynthesis
VRVEALPGFDAAPEWDALAERAANLFATRDWVEAWWHHLGAGEPALFSVTDPGGRPVGLLPLTRTRIGPLRVLRYAGHDVADRLGPVCAPEDRPAVGAAVREALRAGDLDADLLLSERLPGEEEWPRLTGARVLTRESSPVLPIAGMDWESFLASRSSNFRSQVRRLERKLVRDRSLTFRLSTEPDRLDADLDALLSLHRARWSEEGIDAFAGNREAFHRDFARRALEQGRLRLWIAELDGAPAAAWYGMRFADIEWYYQAGRAPEHDDTKIGFVLMAHTIRAAMEDGVGEYRLLRGGEEYKKRFSTEDPGLETATLYRSTAGRAAARALQAAASIPPAHRGRARALVAGQWRRTSA